MTATRGGRKLVAITDQQGNFSFSDLTDGGWTIQVEMQCFQTVQQDVTIGPAAQQTAAAWEFVKFMCSADIQARFSAATGYTAVNLGSANVKSYTDHLAKFPQAEVGTNQLGKTSPDMMGVIVGPSRNFYYEIVNQVSAMLKENKTPEATVQSMSTALNRMLEDYAEANR